MKNISLVVAKEFLEGCFTHCSWTVVRPFSGTITLQLKSPWQEEFVTFVGINESCLESEDELKALSKLLKLELLLIDYDFIKPYQVPQPLVGPAKSRRLSACT